MTTVETWLEAACADAERRGLQELKPMLAALANATRVLRAADWNDDAGAGAQPGSGTNGAPTAERSRQS
jgi:hypothetical protein